MTTNLGKIGFAGIGAMGTPMSTNLIKAGHKLVLFDIDTKKAQAVAATNECEVATSLADLAGKSNTVITMLPDGKLVRKALLGENDSGKNCITETLKPGSLIIDMSSSSPMGTRELGAVLEKKGFQFIDAPVSNGVKGAIAATLSIMVGGDKAIFERVKPMLEKMGNQIYYAGPLGAGHAIKALNNYVSAAGLIAACEALHAAQAFGLDPNVAVDIINTSSGYNGTTQRKSKQFMLSGTYNAGFSTGLMAKDVRTALEIAQAMGTSTILAKPTADIWDAMEKKLGFLSDHTEMHRYTK
ncbi:MAG: NAD(P)-dependent oxidoreductase [Betaproteobacteria bacterium]|nr:NAD(P)-dependent oxidoreductase [Betaproteobacteria bacterium]